MAGPVDELRERIGASLRHLLAGDAEPRERAVGGGLFDETSAVWDVHGDASMLVGGIRALLLQTLHPPTMAGVADHSRYRSDPLGRLRRTSAFVGTTTFGTVEEAERAIRHVRAVHSRITGTTPDGRPYAATDPHLLQWVHVTEVDSFLVAKQRFGSAPLSAGRANEYVAEMAIVARKLGVIDPPDSVTSLVRTTEAYVPELAVNHQSRSALRFLTAPPLPLVMRGPYAVLLGGAVTTLPSWARRKLWLPRIPVAESLTVRPAALTLTRFLGWSLSVDR